MQFGWQRTQKPPIGTPLDNTNPLTRGLVWFAPFWEGGGSKLTDIVNAVDLAVVSGTTWSPGSSPQLGVGLTCTASPSGAAATLPGALKLQAPFTFVCGCRRLGTPTTNSYLMGLALNNTSASPYGNYLQYGYTTGALNLECVDTSATQIVSGNTVAVPLGIDCVVVAIANVNTYTMYVFQAGAHPVTATGSWSYPLGCTYTSTAELVIGVTPAYSRSIDSIVNWAGIYNRALTSNEAAALGRNVWQLFRPVQDVVTLAYQAPGFLFTPTSIYANNPIGQTVSVLGLGTTWTAGTPGSPSFSVSGVTGASKASQTIVSSTSASLTIDTGSTTGTLSVTDGTYTEPLDIIATSIAVSPTAISANHAGDITLTLTGGGTSWQSGTTVFTISGVPGVTKVSQSISSTTAATLVVTTGSGTGTLTISDGADTCPLAVDASSFTLGTASVNYEVPVSVTVTGSTGSLWTTETASTLFSTPGTYGDSISSIVVNSNTSATFTLNPGTATSSLVVTEGPTGATQAFTIFGPGSMRFLGNAYYSTAANSILHSVANASLSFFIKMNSNWSTTSGENVFSCGNIKMIGGYYGNSLTPQVYDSTGTLALTTNVGLTAGETYHFAVSWSASGGTQYVYVNGAVAATATNSNGLGPYSSQSFEIGDTQSGETSDFEISNLAIWNNYSLTLADARALRNQTYTPGNLVGSVSGISQPATNWWPLGGPLNGSVSLTDPSLQDVGSGATHYPFTTFTGTSSNVEYGPALVYVAPTLVTPYVCKSGQLAAFVATSNGTTTASVTGTVSVVANVKSLTTSAPQVGWVGSQIQVSGDSSSGTYTIVGGSGQSYTISPAYGGSSNTAASATLLTGGEPAAITLIQSAPTIQVQFGGSGSFETIHTSGPAGSPISQNLPFAVWQLLCGPVQSVVVQNPGSGYTSPATTISGGGGGSGLTLGTPIMTGGVTSFTISGTGNTGYTSAPTVTIAAPSITLAGCTVTSGSTSVTGISSTTGLIPGMAVLGAGTYSYTIATVVSSTAITLNLPATLSGSSVTLTVIGRNAMATATISGGKVTAINVFTPGSGYPSSPAPTVTLSGGGYASAATVTATVSEIIASIPVTNAGSGYTQPPTIAISDGGSGAGATAAVVMAGVQPGDMVRYSAAESWIETALGGAIAVTNATVANYSGQLEPGVGATLGSALPSSERTLQLGMNYGATYLYNSYQLITNWLTRCCLRYGGYNGLVTYTPDQRPLTLDATSGSPFVINFDYGNPNYVDNTGFPTPTADGLNGRYWTFTYDEIDPASPMVVGITGTAGTFTATSSLSNSGLATTGVNCQLLTLVSGGSGYLDTPTVVFTGGGGSGAAATAYINANGVVYLVVLTATGTGYTSVPEVSFLGGGGGSGASATCTIGSVLSGRTWQFTVTSTTTLTDFEIGLSFYKSLGGTYPWTLVGECLFSPQASAVAYPSLPSRTTAYGGEPAVLAWMQTSTPKYANIVRMMSALLWDGGDSNVVDVCDLRNYSDFSYFNQYVNITSSTPISLAQNPTGNRSIPISYIRSYVLSTTAITSIMVSSGGSGYTSAPTVTITDATGTGAVGTATIGTHGITAIAVSTGGSGYTSAPVISITGGGNGAIGAAATATISGGAVTGVLITNPGYGYTSTPTVAFYGGGGSGATAGTVTTSGSSTIVTGVIVKAGGSGYTSPTVTISGGGGTGATASATVGYPTEVVGGVLVTAAGSGYTSAPTVSFSGGGGTGASATAIISGGAVSMVYMTNMGSGYTSAPTVSFSGGNGTGATATAYIWDVTWSSPNIYLSNPGTGGSTVVSANEAWPGYGSVGNGGGGPYVMQPTSQSFMNPNQIFPTGYAVYEAVTSVPHNLKTGQFIDINPSVQYGPTGQLPYSSGFSYGYGLPSFQSTPVVYVTGATTFAFVISGAQGDGPIQATAPYMPGQMNTASGSFPVTASVAIIAPDNTSISYESASQFVGSLPGTNFWCNIPVLATNATVQSIARRVRDNLPKGRQVWIEYCNEHWNADDNNTPYLTSSGALGIYTNGFASADANYTARACQVRDLIVAVFNETDINGNTNRGSEIKLALGSWDITPSVTSNMITWVNNWEANGLSSLPVVDAVAVAPYPNAPTDVLVPVNAATVSVSGSGGSLPAGSYYIYYTWVDALSGVESSVGSSQGNFNQTTGAEPVVTISFKSGSTTPAWGSASANIYLTAANGAPGTETLYASGVTTTTYTLTSSSWANGTTTQAAAASPPSNNLLPSYLTATAATASHWPTSIAHGIANPWSRPAVADFLRLNTLYNISSESVHNQHQAYLNAYTGTAPPLFVCYEASYTNIVPQYVETGPDPAGYYLRAALTLDLFYDPSFYDVEQSFEVANQNQGFAVINNFAIGTFFFPGNQSGDVNATDIWSYAMYHAQPSGKGDGSTATNGLAVTNQFWANNQAANNAANVAPRLKAWQDWADSTSSLVIPGDLYVTPANGTTNVSPRVVIVVEFNEPMLASTLNSSTFTVKLNGSSVSGTIYYNPTTWAVTFTPASMLDAYATYTAQITTGVTNAQGTALANPVTWMFTTGSGNRAAKPWFSGLRSPTARLTV